MHKRDGPEVPAAWPLESCPNGQSDSDHNLTAGLTAIALVFALGSTLWFFAGRKPLSHAPSILSAAALAGCLSIAVLALLPQADFQRVVDQAGVPIAVLNFATTAAIGFFLAYFRRFTLERDVDQWSPSFAGIDFINSKPAATSPEAGDRCCRDRGWDPFWHSAG